MKEIKLQPQIAENVVFDASQLSDQTASLEAMTVDSLIMSGKTAHEILQELAK